MTKVIRGITLVVALALSACATPKPAAPTSKLAAPASKLAAPALKPAPAGQTVSTTPETPIPFPPGTFTGGVVSTTTPVVRTDRDLLTIAFSIAGPSEVECLLSQKPIAELGALGELADRHPSHLFWGFRSSRITLEARPSLSALFLTLNPPLEPVAAIASRDPDRSLLCVRAGAVPREAFDDAITGLMRSLRVVRPATPPLLVRHCSMTADPDGSVGYETTEIADRVGGGKVVRESGTLAFYRGTSVDLIEVEHREETDARGRIVAASFAKSQNAAWAVRSQLTRVGSGYRAEVQSGLNHEHTFSGEVEVADSEGLLGGIATMRRIKDELLTGRAQELVVEMFDPLESERKTTRLTYRIDDLARRRLTKHAGSNVTVIVVDAEGYTLTSELRLPNSGLVRHTCGD